MATSGSSPPHAPPAGLTSKRRFRRLAALTVLGAALVYAHALPFPYLFDDLPAVADNPLVASGSLTEVWSHDYWGGRPGYTHVTTYRPLTSTSFWAEAATVGLHAPLSRALNVALHALATLLALAVARAYGGSHALALATGALFALLPVHVEAVVGVVNRAELLAFVLAFGALWAWRTGRRPWAVALFGLGLFAKENALTVLGLIALEEWFSPGRPRLPLPPGARLLRVARRLAPLLALTLAMLLLRARVLPALLGGAIPAADNPLVDAGWPARGLTPLALVALAARQVFLPGALSPDWSAFSFPPSGWLDPWPWAGLGLLAGGAWAAWALRRRVPLLGLGLLAAGVTWSVSSNGPFLSTILFADRALYLPSLGLVVALAAGVEQAARALPRPRLAWGLLGLYLLLLTALNLSYARAWRSERALFSHAVTAAPGSARAHAMLGRALLAEGQQAPGEAHLREAMRLDPGQGAAMTQLGALLLGRGDLSGAEHLLVHAALVAPGRADAWVNLAHLRLVQGRPTDALPAAERAVKLAPREPLAWENLGAARLGTGDLSGGVAALEEAIRQGHANPDGIRANLTRLRATAPGP